MTDQIFGSHLKLIEWVKVSTTIQNMYLIIDQLKKSDNYGNGRIWLIREKGGKYKRSKNKVDVESSQFIGMKKCLYSFQLKGIERIGGYWILEVNNGYHNHVLRVY